MQESNYQHHKIPVLEWAANAEIYKGVPVDAADSRFSEPLVNLEEYGIACQKYEDRLYEGEGENRRKIFGTPENLFVRKTVAEMLMRVNAHLEPSGAELFVYSAHRSVEHQKGLWDFFFERAARERPHSTEAELYNHIISFVSDPRKFDPKDSRTWPAHTTGGAVDVTLQSIATGVELDMGVGFDDPFPESHADAFERKLLAGEIAESDARLQNRRLLHWAMTREGFVNYPLEYWHFDYGDQMYVLNSRLLGHADAPEAAWYGYVA